MQQSVMAPNQGASDSKKRWLKSLLLFSLVLTSKLASIAATGIACKTTQECEEIVRNGSECIESGFCSNPFNKRGCLANMLKEHNKNVTKDYIRVCSSADPPEAETLGHCVSADEWGHMEIRLMGNNWESVFFETWIVQVLLSEILGVPTTVDTGYPDKVVDFYDVNSRMEYGRGYDYDALRTATEIVDCRILQQSSNSSEYKQCAHVTLEVWEGQSANLQQLQDEDVIEKPMALGVLGHGGWYIPKYTAQRDPSLLSYMGMEGEHNRYKLAKMFLRPTKWFDYCTEVSLNNCSVPDSVAQRAPEAGEEERFYTDGAYYGYFRETEENDCVNNPFGCTGHISDYPCGWTSFVKQWSHHLNIAVASSGDEPYSRGYSYGQLTEIWAAANHSKSNVILNWWQPEALQQLYIGTDAEFQRLTFPTPTLECTENRVNSLDRCGEDLETRLGSPLGVCDEEPQNLVKALSKVIYETSNDATVPEAKRSPAYEALKTFQISGLQLGIIFKKWLNTGRDKWNYDPREATCQWIVENFELVETLIPRTYPRVMQTGEDSLKEPLMYASFVIGIISLIIVVGVAVAIYKLRNRRAIAVAQVEFLFLLLGGLIMVQIASFVMAVPASNFTCVFATWLKNLGYTLELVPLIVKVTAINKLLSAAKKMKRIKIERSYLFAVVSFIMFLMTVYLMIWTIVDPPAKKNSYELTNDETEYGERVVHVFHFCSSDGEYWRLIALAWRSLLLLWATVLAFQTRNCPDKFNESRSLAIMIYSQFVFLIWSLVLLFMEGNLNVAQIGRYQSLVLSVDVAAVCCIYFVPKLLMSDEQFAEQVRLTRSSVRVSGLGSVSGRSTPNQYTGSDDGSVRFAQNLGIEAHSLGMDADAIRRQFAHYQSSVEDNDAVDSDPPVSVSSLLGPHSNSLVTSLEVLERKLGKLNDIENSFDREAIKKGDQDEPSTEQLTQENSEKMGLNGTIDHKILMNRLVRNEDAR